VDKYSPVLYHKFRVSPDDEDGGTSSRSAGLTTQQIQEIVDYHNKLRRGEGASNMDVMVRSTTESTCFVAQHTVHCFLAYSRLKPYLRKCPRKVK